jgi:hypothetical protein
VLQAAVEGGELLPVELELHHTLRRTPPEKATE